MAVANALGGGWPGLNSVSAATAHATDEKPQRWETGIGQRAVDADMRRRARWQLEQTRLVVDYYRIGRKLAYPLPLSSLTIPDVRVPSIPNYPWATWLLWTLEERICSLGWTAEWFGDEQAREAAAADLTALSQWPAYQQFAGPDLSSAHAGRILWTACTRWSWLAEDLLQSVREASLRHVEAVLPASDKIYRDVRTKEDVLRRDAPHALLHNIPLIGTLGAALAAAGVDHTATPALNSRVEALFGAALDLRSNGNSEGVAYDGYVLDFVADWLTTLPESARSAVLDHPNLSHYLEQSAFLGAAGEASTGGRTERRRAAPDAVPSGGAGQALADPTATGAILVDGACPPEIFSSNALAALRDVPDALSGNALPAGALDAHYAAVLRSGWEAEDLAVAVSCSNSPMGHIQADSGTLVIGTRGNWLVADPGYQQYVQGEERQFTVGPTAHNAPQINGHALSQKRPRRIVLENISPSVHRVAIDLTACYPAEASLERLVRHVWLSGQNLVVVADQIEAADPARATYNWHAHPAAAWWFELGSGLIALHDARLWLTCSQSGLSGADLQRLPGSRGQLSLVSNIDGAGPVVWWIFLLAADRPAVLVNGDARQIRVLDQTFQV